MTVDMLLALLSSVRPCGTGQWRARCPAHDDRNPSLTIRQTEDRVLVWCWAGCTAADICKAIGLTLAKLYIIETRHRPKPDPVALRRRQAAEGLEAWRQVEIQRIAEDLRTRDIIIGHIDASVHAGTLTEDDAWVSIAYEYGGYSDLENKFGRLLHGEDVLEMWRESRRTA